MRFIVIILTGVFGVNGSLYASEEISYPTGYRHWTHVKTLTLHKGHPLQNPFRGIHHIYANPLAFDGLISGQYKNGSKFVFDLLENDTASHASSEGKRVLTAVMIKDKKRFARTGGWGFEAWKKDSRIKRITSDNGVSCFSCHTSQKQADFVFSKWRK